MSGRVKIFSSINRYLPWLKFGLILCFVLFVIAITGNWLVSDAGIDQNKIIIAPSGANVEVPNPPFRNLIGKKLIALTFDDGPNPNTTPGLLDILKSKNAPATFFVLGSSAENNPQIIKRMASEGHEIGSHTMTHQNLSKIPATNIATEINNANNVLKSILNTSPTLIRPPYGAINQEVKKQANAPLIIWSIDPEDWRTKNAEKIAEHIKTHAFNGAIILAHDIYKDTVAAIAPTIDALRADGYEFVTVSELAKLTNTPLKNGEVYGLFR